MYNKKTINVSSYLKWNVCDYMHVNFFIFHLINYSQNVGTLWFEFLFLRFFMDHVQKKKS
jgi:hypothetical protein